MRTIFDVIERMRGIARELPPGDGVACFNRLYLGVTENVAAAIGAGRFEDGAFIAHLDVIFADLFFAAYDAARAGEAPSRAWRPLFAARAAPGILPLQFALAGMNAHINHDLALALVQSYAALGGEPAPGSPRHRDFLVVNQILEETEGAAKAELARGVVRAIDEAMGPEGDVMAMWSVRKARDAAWTQAAVMMALAGTPLHDAFLLTLDRMVGLAGRALLQARAT